MQERKRILVFEPDAFEMARLREALGHEYEISAAATLKEALASVGSGAFRAGFFSVQASEGTPEGIRAIYEASEARLLKAIALADTAELAALSLDAGAFDCLIRPFDPSELKTSLRTAFRHSDLQEKIRPREVAEIGLLGGSLRMHEVFYAIRKVAASDVPVLILGESGTGKELAAREIHNRSERRGSPITVINCGAIPPDLLEAELFGYEKGAFTGADTRRRGRLEFAAGGSIFLDEIGELGPNLQVKLLRFLQEKKIERLGGRKQIGVDARIISATNRDLWKMVKEGSFREDLYHRISVVTVEMPALRERTDDVYILALEFLKRYSREIRKNIEGFSPDAVKALNSHDWPGNVRELENAIKRAVVMCSTRIITPVDLGLPLAKDASTADSNGSVTLVDAKDALRKKLVQETLLKNKGAVSRSARDLGISRQYLTRLINKYNMRPRKGL